MTFFRSSWDHWLFLYENLGMMKCWKKRGRKAKSQPMEKKKTKNSSNLFMDHLNYSCWRGPIICTFQRRQVMKRLSTKQPYNQQVFLFVTKSNIRCIHTANFSLCFLFIRGSALYIYVSNPIFSCRNPGELL